MNRLLCLLCLLIFIFPLAGCGGSGSAEIPIEEDPALVEEGNPSADAGGQEIDPAL